MTIIKNSPLFSMRRKKFQVVSRACTVCQF